MKKVISMSVPELSLSQYKMNKIAAVLSSPKQVFAENYNVELTKEKLLCLAPK
jgi:hypothetical protein